MVLFYFRFRITIHIQHVRNMIYRLGKRLANGLKLQASLIENDWGEIMKLFVSSVSQLYRLTDWHPLVDAFTASLSVSLKLIPSRVSNYRNVSKSVPTFTFYWAPEVVWFWWILIFDLISVSILHHFLQTLRPREIRLRTDSGWPEPNHGVNGSRWTPDSYFSWRV